MSSGTWTPSRLAGVDVFDEFQSMPWMSSSVTTYRSGSTLSALLLSQDRTVYMTAPPSNEAFVWAVRLAAPPDPGVTPATLTLCATSTTTLPSGLRIG